MGKLVVTEFVSLDGVFQDPAWTFRFDRGEDGDRFKLDELTSADAQLLGRVTYEGFAAAWPGRTDEVGFADKMNTMPKYVVSETLHEAEWANSTIISGDLRGEVQKLKDTYGGDILVAGSGTLVRGLLGADLVDELHLMVFPLVLGSGRLLLTEGTAETTFSLVDMARVGPDGVVTMTYARRPAAG